MILALNEVHRIFHNDINICWILPSCNIDHIFKIIATSLNHYQVIAIDINGPTYNLNSFFED